MSSEKRVLVGTLFLPHAISFNLSPSRDVDFLDLSNADGSKSPIPPKSPISPISPSSMSNSKPILGSLSIVDDLTERASTPFGVQQPQADQAANPFFSAATTPLSPHSPGFAALSRVPSATSTAAHTLAFKSVLSNAAKKVAISQGGNDPTAAIGGGINRVIGGTTDKSKEEDFIKKKVKLEQVIKKEEKNSIPMISQISSSSEGVLNTPFNLIPSGSANGGLIHAITSVNEWNPVWIGYPGVPVEEIEPEEIHEAEEMFGGLGKGEGGEGREVPVWIEEKVFKDAYEVFCKQVLWPTFHYMPDFTSYKTYDSASFVQYKLLNQQFADAIVAEYKEGDTILISDYHLLLVPSMIREKLPLACISLFVHTAFPSSETVRCLATREELLEGMLAADLVGFQTFHFARHFRRTVSRILQYETTPIGVSTNRGFCNVGVFPIGIDVAALNIKRQDPEVREWIDVLKRRYSGMKLILGRDKMDYVKGVRHKLKAFERFLEEHPEWHNKVVFFQVGLATTEINETASQCTDVVSSINSRFSNLEWQAAVLLHQDVTFSQWLALMTVADVFVVTSLRDGMNLSSHEYVACQDETHRPLILSEFTGAYTYTGFRSCLPVNPWDTAEVSHAIYEALTMSSEEATRRWEELSKHVLRQSAQNWTRSLLSETQKTHQSHRYSLRPQKPEPTTALLDGLKKGGNLTVVLDFEETLFVNEPKVDMEKGFVVKEDVKDVIERLNSVGEVWVLSGKKIEDLTGFSSTVGIIADDGCEVKPPNGEWISLTEGLDLEWRKAALESLAYYTERTPGAFIEKRGVTICWRYPSANDKSEDGSDPEWGRRQAAECQNHIMDSVGERYSLHIVQGSSAFLIIPSSCSRSNALSRGFQGKVLENVIYVGRDGQVFDKLREKVEKVKGKFISVEVGGNRTEAEFSVASVKDARKVLEGLL